jgi:hypothetical protein
MFLFSCDWKLELFESCFQTINFKQLVANGHKLQDWWSLHKIWRREKDKEIRHRYMHMTHVTADRFVRAKFVVCVCVWFVFCCCWGEGEKEEAFPTRKAGTYKKAKLCIVMMGFSHQNKLCFWQMILLSHFFNDLGLDTCKLFVVT